MFTLVLSDFSTWLTTITKYLRQLTSRVIVSLVLLSCQLLQSLEHEMMHFFLLTTTDHNQNVDIFCCGSASIRVDLWSSHYYE